MPRITIITLLAILFAPSAFAGQCGDRVQAFNVDEDYNDQMERQDTVSIFDITDFSPHSSFQGFVISNKENAKTKVEVEVRKSKSGDAVRKEAFGFEKFESEKGYLSTTEDFDPVEFLKFENGFFMVRLLLNGKEICADSPREIQSSEH